jgi:hypothetical protein
MSDSAEIDEWFGAGWAVFQGDRAEESFLPLSDMEAQREWLAGFGSTWVECPDEAARDANCPGGLLVDEALVRALDGRGELLRQLRAHGRGHANRSVH